MAGFELLAWIEPEKPVVTKVAAIELVAGFRPSEPVNTSMAAYGPEKPVVIEVAAFERDFGPSVPGERTTIPGDRR